MKKWLGRGLLALALGLSAPAAHAAKAEWHLDNKDSRLDFVSVKKGNIGEVHHFDTLSGVIRSDGRTAITIDLASVQTWIKIRNERLEKYLFETSKFPTATITTMLDMKQFEHLDVGEQMSTSTEVTLTLHGVSHKVEAGLQIFRLTKNRVLVIPDEIIMLDASAYDLKSGLEKLKELAGLESISTAVPVDFHFVFERR